MAFDFLNPFSGDGLFTKNSILGDVPIVGTVGRELNLFESDADRAHEAKQAEFERSKELYQQLSPLLEQARMNSLGNQLALYNPVNEMLSEIYGPGSSLDIQSLMRNPIPAGMGQVGDPSPLDPQGTEFEVLPPKHPMQQR